ncbi:Penicillin-binding protein 1F [Pseudooceanicola marinus]|uniref:peptidoglycan glycosyltransferase n=1 Tax=Pseudooceanicola marinus TaxID=396013 RepID=A0A1X6ZMD4_9RHOB|nr:penicillin-binding protein 1C [Pseudooceanicola marinus]PJE26640.1 penicillin-binding protein 1C [Pseudooceanicola marinus]SLN56034.1 Penicillin-binding protein 1F [Pseudooceanicola marinus]
MRPGGGPGTCAGRADTRPAGRAPRARSRRRALPFLALAALLWAGGLARDRVDDWIDATQLPPLAPQLSVEMHGADGALLRAYMVDDGRWRMGLTPDQVDPLYLAMLKAYEDRRFDDHAGVDPHAVLRAAWQALREGEVVSGGSTLTMQVARLLENSGTGLWAGKLRQARLALALERRLTKDQVLALYLALAPMGGNLEGVRAAALAYFGKEPTRLTPAQAALLVALPQAPEARRPDRDPLAAEDARNRVLARMVAEGVIDFETARAARRDSVPRTRRPFPQLAPHLTDRARAELPELARHDLTLDVPLQAALEQLAATALQGMQPDLSVAILVADHRDGRILASVGSRGFAAQGHGFVDMTRALRSPGSTLKPLIYAMAFDAGLAHPETLIDDVPTDFAGYRPVNFDGAFRGPIPVREALQLSLNLPVVALTEALGPARVLSTLRRAGVAAELPGGAPGLAISLGGLGVTLDDLVTLYAGLAEGGTARPLYWRQGAAEGAGARLVSAPAAWQVGHILADLVPPEGGPRGRISWKTGTSYGHRDAWALGWDGAHVVGVWIGRPDGTPVPGAFGGDLAAPLLFQAFQRLAPEPVELPAPPRGTLLVTNDALPVPLRHFRRRGGTGPDPQAPRLAFPPDGARLALSGDGLPVRVERGTPPFTWLINGAPVLTGQRRGEALLPSLGQGFTDVTVIDAMGRSARTTIRLN